MFIPRAFNLEPRPEILDLLWHRPFGHLVTVGTDRDAHGVMATSVPFVVDDDLTRVRAHVARANRHWTTIDGAQALLIVTGADSYVSPRWYPSKQEHGKVVPTWNYEVIHLHGTVHVHDDTSWKRQQITDLTRHNEAAVSDNLCIDEWEVSDAPDDFIDKQLTAIVGIELEITDIQAKRKLSQNRSAEDQTGVINGLRRSERAGDAATAEIMETGPLGS